MVRQIIETSASFCKPYERTKAKASWHRLLLCAPVGVRAPLKGCILPVCRELRCSKGQYGQSKWKTDQLSPEVFLLNFLLIYGIAWLKDGDECSSLQWISGILSAWSGSALVIPFRWGFRNYLIFDKSGIGSNHHFLWQGNQHVTSDFAVGFFESLEIHRTLTCQSSCPLECVSALNSCLVLLFQHFCMVFFFLCRVFTTVRRAQNLSGSNGSYSPNMSNTLHSETWPAAPAIWDWWFFISLFWWILKMSLIKCQKLTETLLQEDSLHLFVSRL